MAKTVIFRQCITLKNGRRICLPKGRAFPITIDVDEPEKPKGE